jgi:hypothetical protein
MPPEKHKRLGDADANIPAKKHQLSIKDLLKPSARPVAGPKASAAEPTDVQPSNDPPQPAELILELIRQVEHLQVSRDIESFVVDQSRVLSALRTAINPPAPVAVLSWAVPRYASNIALVKTKDYVAGLVWDAFERLHNNCPTHPIFGECEKGKIHALFRLPGGKGAATSWHMKAQKLGGNVAKNMGEYMPRNSCWMVLEDSTHIRKRGVDGKEVDLVTFKTYRLLAFLADPTSVNWNKLTGQLEGTGKSIENPFLHCCHNGHASQRAKKALGCVNSLQHGGFGSVTDNNLQQDCRPLDRARCPGHGPDKILCIFVHGDGQPKPCLNLDSTPAECSCVRKCF